MLLILLEGLLNKLGIIVVFVFLLSKSNFFKRYVLKEKLSLYDKIFFSFVFGGLGILFTYWGIPVHGGIANSRSIVVVAAGMLGGTAVGTGAGLIAGIHRMFVRGGPLTSFACGISTIIGGLIGGRFKKYIEEKQDKWLYGILIGIIVETIQMVIILLISRPFDEAFYLVRLIFMPMTFINAMGIGIFVILIEQIYDEQEKAGALKAQLALNIANCTLPYLRKGLNEFSAQETAEIIYKMTGSAAVAITNTEKILAHVGLGDDHHKKGDNIRTNITKRVIEEGRFMVAQERGEIDCINKNCSLKSVIVVPLKEQEKTIGTLKLYKNRENSITSSDIELAKGLGHLFSTQLELSQIDYQKELLSQSEIKALQAQIQPHFLFNALNTIVSFCRTDPNQARELLLKLSYYLRSSFKNQEDFIPLEKEIQLVEAYLSIEQARFSERLKVEYDIEPSMNITIPPLILQPIVENAVKHGLLPKSEGGTVKISAYSENKEAIIKIKDDGVGMSKDQVQCLLDTRCKKEGVGVSNVNNRLQSIYGHKLEIDSDLGHGTTVIIRIPLKGCKKVESDISG